MVDAWNHGLYFQAGSLAGMISKIVTGYSGESEMVSDAPDTAPADFLAGMLNGFYLSGDIQ
jgi:hypothetical protein